LKTKDGVTVCCIRYSFSKPKPFTNIPTIMAQQTVVGVFDSAEDAQRAARELAEAGFSRETVDVASRNSQGSTAAASYNAIPGGRDSSQYNETGTTTGAPDRAGRDTNEGTSSIGRFFRNLFSDDDDTYNRYSSVAEQSNSILTVHVSSEENARRAAEIMDRCGAIDVDERAAQYGYNAAASRQDFTSDARTAGPGQTVQVVQEELQVGKREVTTGGARLRSRIVERPVEENLRLREERVFVERHPVNRPATDADFNTFREGTIELTETAEVPVVQKEARVVEEVSLGKEVNERTETIRDSVRSTEVEVERISGDRDVAGDRTNHPMDGHTGTGPSSIDQ
jgi:uncharacterized protein (TIGR02271 family)